MSKVSYQSILKATVFGVFEDLKKAQTKIEVVLALDKLRQPTGQLQFWSEPSEILNLRSSNTSETVVFNIP